MDTNVVLDVFTADPVFLERSRDALRVCIQQGRLVACDVVWAEIAAFFPDGATAHEALRTVGVDFESLTVEAALTAGTAWAEYHRRGGKRKRMIADFLIGAHAAAHADRLLTRDRGFYRSYFGDLEVWDPSSA